MAGIAVKSAGVTLIELVIVMAVMGILLSIAVPSYQKYTLRVNRTEAIRLLLQASMCQESVYARIGNYDTSKCLPASEYKQYQVSYMPEGAQSETYLAMATPTGAQRSDPCGSLSLDQTGARSIGGVNISTAQCWNGR